MLLPTSCLPSMNTCCLPNICVFCKLYYLLHVLHFIQIPCEVLFYSPPFLANLTTAWPMMKHSGMKYRTSLETLQAFLLKKKQKKPRLWGSKQCGSHDITEQRHVAKAKKQCLFTPEEAVQLPMEMEYSNFDCLTLTSIFIIIYCTIYDISTTLLCNS